MKMKNKDIKNPIYGNWRSVFHTHQLVYGIRVV